MNDLSLTVTVVGLSLWVLLWVAEKVWIVAHGGKL